jgi:3',5'-nucleoside bisphosphate phosphatase
VRVDLHMHSTASDGSLSPGALVSAARAGGLHVIALTDHDTVDGFAEARAAGAGIIEVIPGIEMSTMHQGGELHILGYFVDTSFKRLRDYAHAAARRRNERMHGMIARLGEIGVTVSYEDVLRGADHDTRSLGRPHLARALIERGHATTMNDAFERFIGDDGPGYLPVRLLSSEDAIALIHAAGGVAIWAHPRLDHVDAAINTLVGFGLDGLECYRPRCLPADSLRLEQLARGRGLLVTGGSDWHGSWHGRLGDFAVTQDEIGEFLERGGI